MFLELFVAAVVPIVVVLQLLLDLLLILGVFKINYGLSFVQLVIVGMRLKWVALGGATLGRILFFLLFTLLFGKHAILF